MAYYSKPRSEMRGLVPERCSNVLEIGCGEGSFRTNVQTSTIYWGVEPDVRACQIAKASLDTVLCGRYDDVQADIPAGLFDLVVCNDVIEHMSDHQQFLQSIKTKMKNNGVLIGSVPNVRFLGNLYSLIIDKDWKYETTGILDATHLRFFTFKSLQRVLLDTGFDIEMLIGLNPITYSGRAHVRLLKKVLGSSLCKIIGNDAAYLQIGFRAVGRHPESN
jgi:2-polyprenyl-3-methyl-5-hydroxy-6-metoxy-1,4-benzoquinol methylase